MKRLVLLTLTLALALPAFAQSPSYPPDSDAYWHNVSKQARVILKSPYPSIRAQGLKNAIYYATYLPDRVSLDGTVGRIIRLHEREHDPYMRRLAVAALEAIGDTEAKRYLAARIAPEEKVASHQLIVEVLDEMGRGTGASTL